MVFFGREQGEVVRSAAVRDIFLEEKVLFRERGGASLASGEVFHAGLRDFFERQGERNSREL